MKLRRWLQWMFAVGLAHAGVFRFARQELRRCKAVLTLTFHRVLEKEDYKLTNSLPGIVVQGSTFTRLCAYLHTYYRPIAIDEARPGQLHPTLPVLVTFDDGWKDNRTVAFPIAAHYQVPLLIFICPDLLDRLSPFWPERVISALRRQQPEKTAADLEQEIERLKQLDSIDLQRELQQMTFGASHSGDATLSMDDVKVMSREGVEFGSHTLTHTILTTVPLDQARSELQLSKEALGVIVKRPCETFAYPNGNTSDELRALLRQEGYRRAFTTEPGVWSPETDPLAIPRINVCEENITTPWGSFSAAMFEFTTTWKAWRVGRRMPTTGVRSAARIPQELV